ncbi:hypothetical protein Dimus_006040 [Dionaea muscipula]
MMWAVDRKRLVVWWLAVSREAPVPVCLAVAGLGGFRVAADCLVGGWGGGEDSVFPLSLFLGLWFFRRWFSFNGSVGLGVVSVAVSSAGLVWLKLRWVVAFGVRGSCSGCLVAGLVGLGEIGDSVVWWLLVALWWVGSVGGALRGVCDDMGRKKKVTRSGGSGSDGGCGVSESSGGRVSMRDGGSLDLSLSPMGTGEESTEVVGPPASSSILPAGSAPDLVACDVVVLRKGRLLLTWVPPWLGS